MTDPAVRYGPYAAALLVLVSMLLLVGSAAYSINQQRTLDRKLCEATVRHREGMRAVFDEASNIFEAQSENPQEVERLFERILRPIPPLECRGNQPVPKED